MSPPNFSSIASASTSAIIASPTTPAATIGTVSVRSTSAANASFVTRSTDGSAFGSAHTGAPIDEPTARRGRRVEKAGRRRHDPPTHRGDPSAGIFAKVSSAQIAFDGFSQGGSSGSPVFNASGEVVAVHFASLKNATGLGFAIPVAKVIGLLPGDAKGELGIR